MSTAVMGGPEDFLKIIDEKMRGTFGIVPKWTQLETPVAGKVVHQFDDSSRSGLVLRFSHVPYKGILEMRKGLNYRFEIGKSGVFKHGNPSDVSSPDQCCSVLTSYSSEAGEDFSLERIDTIVSRQFAIAKDLDASASIAIKIANQLDSEIKRIPYWNVWPVMQKDDWGNVAWHIGLFKTDLNLSSASKPGLMVGSLVENSLIKVDAFLEKPFDLHSPFVTHYLNQMTRQELASKPKSDDNTPYRIVTGLLSERGLGVYGLCGTPYSLVDGAEFVIEFNERLFGSKDAKLRAKVDAVKPGVLYFNEWRFDADTPIAGKLEDVVDAFKPLDKNEGLRLAQAVISDTRWKEMERYLTKM